MQTPFFLYKSGVYELYVSRTCFSDVEIIFFSCLFSVPHHSDDDGKDLIEDKQPVLQGN